MHFVWASVDAADEGLWQCSYADSDWRTWLKQRSTQYCEDYPEFRLMLGFGKQGPTGWRRFQHLTVAHDGYEAVLVRMFDRSSFLMKGYGWWITSRALAGIMFD